jgi:hypothetical protein
MLAWPLRASSTSRPGWPARPFSVLMRNGKELRSELIVRPIHQRVGEAIEMVDAQTEVTEWAAVLVLNE